MATSPAGGPLFLGLDLSTQQLKAVIIDNEHSIVHENAVHFDRDLPRYGTTNGAISGPRAGEITSPVEMWLEAIDLLMTRMKESGVNFSIISAVSGAAQQHGSVYWSYGAQALLSSLDPTRSLRSQLFPDAFALLTAPIWQDSSTTRECKVLEDSVGGPQALADTTGSRAYERFTGNQVAKIRRIHSDAYNATCRISLISSFISTLILGDFAPMELSDASGMNLMDIRISKWDDHLLDICGGPELRSKLGPEPVIGGTVLGRISAWFVKRWGFDPSCIVAPCTGDNPASVVALSRSGDAILSLGTSTTFLLSIPPTSTPPRRFITSHLLAHPTDFGGHIAMLCYKNGALAREQIRDEYASGNWNRFNEQVEATPMGNSGYLGLYFPLPEIIPPNVLGRFFFQMDIQSDNPVPNAIDDIPSSAHPRAILESQFLSIRCRIADILPEGSCPLQRLVLTGGSSANRTFQQVAADVFGMEVFVSSTKEAGSVGGAILARYAWWKSEGSGKEAFEEKRAGLQRVAGPRKEAREIYDKIARVFGPLLS